MLDTTPELQTILDKADLSQAYEARQIENDLYRWWEQAGYFEPRMVEGRRPFVISMPPPNVTGRLHTGHGLTMTIEDILVRWHRMLGDPTLWVPGTDHAGIATQGVVEKDLAKQGLTRHDLGREEFVKRVWAWKEQYGSEITQQLRRIGASCDWSRERFTLDPGLSRAVHTAFKQLYDDGLIYRGTYLVNWSPKLGTAVSDLEVEHEERQMSMYHVRYPLESEEWQPGAWGSGRWAEGTTEWITVATTRPETILGDTAVAVNPEDERYKDVIGRTAVLPALGRPIPIIADEYADPQFGTGAVKITPAHDPNDYQVGLRQKLPMINIMNKDATLNAEAGPYAGLDRFDARKALLADLEKEGLLVETRPHTMSVGISQRGGEIVEPLLSEQWFVRMQPLAEKALAAVREGRTRIVPERFEKVYFHWLENIQDWCISRQLWWGHRIPVWYTSDGQMVVPSPDEAPPADATQDPDVLDTWFSSGLWPFSTLGWPEETEDYRTFYPTTVMETGYDILFFWVARMMMLGVWLTGKEPFETIYLHGIVRDEHGRKMSKSLNNTVDPLELMDQYGTDATRFTFATSSTPGQDFALQPTRLEAARNFANKIWNATRFVISKLGDQHPDKGVLQYAPTLADRWILGRYHRLTADVDRLMRTFNLGEAGRQIQSFFWDDFADWYIETAKVQLENEAQATSTRAVLYTVLEGTLRLLHPFMPFVTEAAWQHLVRGQAGTLWVGVKGQGRAQPFVDSNLQPSTPNPTPEALIVAPYPQSESTLIDEAAERDWELVRDIVRGIRNVRNESGVEAARWIEAIIVGGDRTVTLDAQRPIISRLARVAPDKLAITEALDQKPEQAAALVVGTTEIYLPLAGMVDLQEERARLSKELQRIEADVERRKGKLANENFVLRAPAAVVQKERDALTEAEAAATKLRERLAALN
jgi:valyl-tRNA synthetase